MVTVDIKPEDIDVSKGSGQLMDSIWQNMETEASAYYLVKLAQKNGSWRDFTKKEIDKIAKEDFWFNKLRRWPFDISNEPYDYITFEPKTNMIKSFAGGVFSFTDKFINEVYRLSPKKSK